MATLGGGTHSAEGGVMGTLFLCGAGNSEGVRLAMQCAESHGLERIVLLDDDPSLVGFERIGVPVVGALDALNDADPSVDRAVNLVARRTVVRRKVRGKIMSSGVPFVPLIHPSVETLGVVYDEDVIAYQNVTLGPEVTLGPGSCVFMGAVVGHESETGECCVMAANSVLNARVMLDDCVYVGTNSTVLPEISIGEDATIGAGSVVVADLAAGETAIGAPAEVVRTSSTPGLPSEDPAAALATIWAEILGVSSVDPGMTFFDLGGDSLGALRVRNRVRSELGIEVPALALFQFPTLSAFSAQLLGTGRAHAQRVTGSRSSERRAAMERRRRVRR